MVNTAQIRAETHRGGDPHRKKCADGRKKNGGGVRWQKGAKNVAGRRNSVAI